MSRSRWYYDRGGEVKGPLRVSELRQLAASGELQPTDRVRTEDMDQWVKARAVKGLFGPAEPPAGGGAAAGDSVFDFFGSGSSAEIQPPPAADTEFIPAFDFFSGQAEPPKPQPPRREAPKRKPSAIELLPPLPPPAAGEDRVTFQPAVPMAAPAEPPPLPGFAEPEVPMAMPASAVDLVPPPKTAELTGPEVTVHADGSAHPTGAVVELSVSGGWLLAQSAGPDGKTAETWLRLGRLESASLRDRPGAGVVVSFHAGAQAVAVQCDGHADAARAFLRRVVEAAG